MSCWVVPSVAAELWGIPLEQLMGQIRAGAVTSRTEHGFVMVDVAPDSERIAPAPRRRRPRTRTFTPAVEPGPTGAASVVSDAELAALGIEARPTPAAAADGLRPEEPCDIAMRVAAAAADSDHYAIGPACDEHLHEDEMGPAGDPDPDRDGIYADEGPPLHWQVVRARVARTRKPPGARAGIA
jgi:hypothetical protein